MSLKPIVWLLAAPALALVLFLIILIGEQVFGGRGPHCSSCKTIISALESGCRTYKIDFGEYPPGRPDFDSRVLHHYLGSPRVVKTGDGIERRRGPYIDFPATWLKSSIGQIPDPANPVQILDPWDRPIRYANPGNKNPGGVDIWSAGPNGKDELDDPNSDDIRSWVKEY